MSLYRQLLTPLYPPREVTALTRMMLEEVLHLSYTQILLHSDDVLTPSQHQLLEGYAQRLATGEPIQQVLGYAYFRGRRFGVNPSVLIPRPETEQLIDLMAADLGDGSDPASVSGHACPQPCSQPSAQSVDNPVRNLLDIGTGSGCIALSLALDIPRVFITAADISTGALTTAQENAKTLAVNNIRFVEADILREDKEDFSTELSTSPEGGATGRIYDAIVSNPPYICHREAEEMERNVLEHEPHLALFVPDDDPLLFYRTIAHYALRHLCPQGRLYFEINTAYGAETCQLLQDLGFADVKLHNDFTDRPRFVSARFLNVSPMRR